MNFRFGRVGLRFAALLMLFAFAPGARAATYAHVPATFGWIDPSAHTPVVWTGAPGGPAAECTGGSAALDDDISQELPLGFTFNYGGTNYTSVRVMSNGRLQFNNRFCGYGTQTVSPRTYPYPYANANVVRTMRVYGADLDPSAGGAVSWASIGSAPDRRFVVTWTAVPEWNAAGSFFDLQAILNENGQFVYQFGASNNPSGGKAQIGWELSTADYDTIAFTAIGTLAGTAILFYPAAGGEPAGGFNAFETSTGAGSIAGVIRTKVSARSFDLALVALNAAESAVATGFTGSVKVELLDSSNNSGALDAAGCRASWVPLPGFTPLTASFAAADAGRKNVTLTAANAWREVRVRMTTPATGTPTATGCSNDAFALRPASLGVAASDADAQSAGTARMLANTGAPGGVVHKAGRPFTLTATAYDDASAITTNWQGSPSATLTAFLLPSSCLNGGPGCVLATGAFAGSGGTVVSNTATYGEAGAFTLRLTDADWAAVDAADSSADEREIRSAPVAVGRFVPDHFRLAAGSTLTPACAAGGFSYMGEPFGVSLTLLAENAAGEITMNYHEGAGAFSAAQLAGLSWVAENADDGVSLAARLVPPATPSWANGSLMLPAAAQISLGRRTAPDTPDGPFDSLRIGIGAADPDATVKIAGMDMNAATSGDCVGAGTCDAAAIGAATRVRFGRLRMINAHGSELRSLPVPVRAEFWNGTGFATNTLDGCTAIGTVTPNPAPSTCTLNPARSGEGTPLVAGTGTLTLAAPNARGCTDLLMTTPSWLLGRRDATDQSGDGNLHDDAAAARATFGIFRDVLILRREVFR